MKTQFALPHDHKLIDIVGMNYLRSISIGTDIYHAQGLSATENDYFFTGVKTKKSQEAYLFKMNNKSNSIIRRKITQSNLVHPSGIQYHDGFIWLALAEYKKHSRSLIQKIDPENLTVIFEFGFNDHIGAVACDDKTIYGANWDTETIYCWDLKGNLIRQKNYKPGLKIQDFEIIEGYLIGVGGSEGWFIIINPETLDVLKTILLPKMNSKNRITREGFSHFNGHFYFLPDDGPDAKIIVCSPVTIP